MLNVHDIAQDVGVSDDTAKRWLQVLEKSDVIFFLRPYSNNLLKRTVKTPKMYFFDSMFWSFSSLLPRKKHYRIHKQILTNQQIIVHLLKEFFYFFSRC